MRHRNERGFSLLEVVVATALTAFVIIALASAVAKSIHGTSLVETKVAMRTDALNVLADLRAATAYDAGALQKMVDRTASMTIAHSASDIETISVRVTVEANRVPSPLTQGSSGPATISAPVDIAEATVTELGETVTERQVLYAEAPTPGSSVDQ